jgi:hypothetical protein
VLTAAPAHDRCRVDVTPTAACPEVGDPVSATVARIDGREESITGAAAAIR